MIFTDLTLDICRGTDTAILGEFIWDAACISVLRRPVPGTPAFLCVTEDAAETSTATPLERVGPSQALFAAAHGCS